MANDCTKYHFLRYTCETIFNYIDCFQKRSSSKLMSWKTLFSKEFREKKILKKIKWNNGDILNIMYFHQITILWCTAYIWIVWKIFIHVFGKQSHLHEKDKILIGLVHNQPCAQMINLNKTTVLVRFAVAHQNDFFKFQIDIWQFIYTIYKCT